MNMTFRGGAATTHELLAFATCPSCRTTDATITNDTDGKGAEWRCAQCGETWSARPLTTVAAFAAWVSRQTIPARGNC